MMRTVKKLVEIYSKNIKPFETLLDFVLRERQMFKFYIILSFQSAADSDEEDDQRIQRKSTVNKKMKNACDECGKVFKHSSSLREHLISHSG